MHRSSSRPSLAICPRVSFAPARVGFAIAIACIASAWLARPARASASASARPPASACAATATALELGLELDLAQAVAATSQRATPAARTPEAPNQTPASQPAREGATSAPAPAAAPPRSTALVAPQARAALAARASTELAQVERALADALLARDPWRAFEPSGAALALYDLAARKAWREALGEQAAKLAAIEAALLSPQRRADQARMVALCRAELATLAVWGVQTQDPALQLERIERSLRVLVLPGDPATIDARVALLRTRVEALPSTLDALRLLITDPTDVGVAAAIAGCQRLREFCDVELASLVQALPESNADRAALDAARGAGATALRALQDWLAKEAQPRAARTPRVAPDAWTAIAQDRTGSELAGADIALALLRAISDLEALASGPRAPVAAAPLGAADLAGASQWSRAARGVIEGMGIVAPTTSVTRMLARGSASSVLPTLSAWEVADGSRWLEIGVPHARWPAGARAQREFELSPLGRAPFAVAWGMGGAGLRVSQRAVLGSSAQRLLADESVDLGFGYYVVEALQQLELAQNPLHANPAFRAAAARMLRLECARLYVASQLHTRQRSDELCIEDLARYGGIEPAAAADELSEIARDPWRGLAALAWLEFRALEHELALAAATPKGPHAAALRVLALATRNAAARPSDLRRLADAAARQARVDAEGAQRQAPQAQQTPARRTDGPPRR